eukprot:TRINITY_DN21196_c0_g1_i1.p1 TRINITY_DN21196_c0_g1~~TRINITY_DN21196_c0_g1_i1.p1  ORF type:complete len:2943 (-),score=595.19 TRINITY_DN21196_c0_g1_i1:530-9358(-)
MNILFITLLVGHAFLKGSFACSLGSLAVSFMPTSQRLHRQSLPGWCCRLSEHPSLSNLDRVGCLCVGDPPVGAVTNVSLEFDGVNYFVNVTAEGTSPGTETKPIRSPHYIAISTDPTCHDPSRSILRRDSDLPSLFLWHHIVQPEDAMRWHAAASGADALSFAVPASALHASLNPSPAAAGTNADHAHNFTLDWLNPVPLYLCHASCEVFDVSMLMTLILPTGTPTATPSSTRFACNVSCMSEGGGECPPSPPAVPVDEHAIVDCMAGEPVPPTLMYPVTSFAGTGDPNVADGPRAEASFHGPVGITVDVDGSFWVAEYFGYVVRRISAEGVVTTVAGVAGVSGYSNGAAESSHFKGPYRLVSDGMGGMLVSDFQNCCVRRVAGGMLSDFAGSCTVCGYAEGAVNTGQLGNPSGMVRLSDGTFLLADSGTHTIRRMSATGVLSLFAGAPLHAGAVDGVGATARFARPLDLAVDAADGVYITDWLNSCVRRAAPDGTVTTLAGACGSLATTIDGTGSSARFDGLRGIALHSPSGDLFLTERYGHAVRRLTASGVTSSVVSGGSVGGYADGPGATARFTQPHGIVFVGNTLYVAEFGGHRIRRIDVDIVDACETIGQVVPAVCSACTASCSDRGSGVCDVSTEVFAKGNTTGLGCTVGTREVAQTQVTTFAGNGGTAVVQGVRLLTSFADPFGIGVGADGLAVVVVERGMHILRTLTREGEAVMLTGTVNTSGYSGGNMWNSLVNEPYGVVWDGADGLLIADRENHCIRIAAVGILSDWAGTCETAGSADGPLNTGTLSHPSGMARAADGTVYIGDVANYVVRKATSTGVLSSFVGSLGVAGTADGTGGAAEFAGPSDLVVSSGGDVFVVDSPNNCIRRVTTGAVVTTFAGICGTLGLVVDGTGSAARFDSPGGITEHLATGDLYTVDRASPTVRRITPGGVVTTVAGTGVAGYADGTGLEAAFDMPHGVVAIEDDLLVADRGNRRIRRIRLSVESVCLHPRSPTELWCSACEVTCTTRGAGACPAGTIPPLDPGEAPSVTCAAGAMADVAFVVDTFAGTGVAATTDGPRRSAAFDGPISINRRPDGHVVVTEYQGRTVRLIKPDGTVELLAGIPQTPGYAVGPAETSMFSRVYDSIADGNDAILVTDLNHGCILRIDAGVVTPWAGTCSSPGYADGAVGVGRLLQPSRMERLSNGSLLISDAGSHCLRIASPSGVLTTFVGNPSVAGVSDGTGSAAHFRYPYDLLVVSGDEVYVADGLNQCIRHVTPGGVVTTFAGTCGALPETLDGVGAAARFHGPRGIVQHAGTGMLFVAEYTGHTIRAITPARVVTTVAGTGASGHVDGAGVAAEFHGPHGLLLAGEELYIAEIGGNRLRRLRFDLRSAQCERPYATMPVWCRGCDVTCTEEGAGQCPATLPVLDPGGTAVAAGVSCDVGRRSDPSYTVMTVAGNGTSGHTDTADPLAAMFASPLSVVQHVESAQLVVAEYSGHIIRTISLTGAVATYAGVAGSPGHTNGPRLSAQFRDPYRISVAPDGAFIVADRGNDCLRRIISTGVADYAGTCKTAGTADGALGTGRLKGPAGLGWRSDGTLLIADTDNHAVRLATPAGSTATLSTYVGLPGTPGALDATGTAARFRSPFDLTVTSGDVVYVSDSVNNCIRKVTPAQVVTTLAGMCGAMGRRMDGTGTGARFHGPRCVVHHEATGDLYVCDSLAGAIRRVSPAAVVTTVAGLRGEGFADGPGWQAQLGAPHGATILGDALVFADLEAQRIRQMRLTDPATCDAPFEPLGVACTACDVTCSTLGSGVCPGSLPVLDPAETPATGGATCASGNPPPLALVTTLSGNGANAVTDGKGASAAYKYPLGIGISSTGQLMVAEYTSHVLRWILASGLVTTIAGTPDMSGHMNGDGATALFNLPYRMIMNSDNDIIVSDRGNFCLRKITGTLGAWTVSDFAGTCTSEGSADGAPGIGRMRQPSGIALTASGDILVADGRLHMIRRVSPAGDLSLLAGTGERGTADGLGSDAWFDAPYDLMVDGSSIWVSDSGNNCIRHVTPAGQVTTFAGLCGAPDMLLDGTGYGARFSNPRGIVMHSGTGNMYVTEVTSSAIREITPTARVRTIAGGSGDGYVDGAGASARFKGLHGVVMVGDELYLTETANRRIRQVHVGAEGTCDAPFAAVEMHCAGCDVSCITGGAGGCPSGVSVAANESVAETGLSCPVGTPVTAMYPTTTFAGNGTSAVEEGPRLSTSFSWPLGVGTAADGSVMVAESYDHVIRRIHPETGMVTVHAGQVGVPGHMNGAASTALFSFPYRVIADGFGGLIVSDFDNQCLRKITGGSVTDFAGTCGSPGTANGAVNTARFYAPAGISLGSSRDVYVADSSNSAIRKVSPTGSTTTLSGMNGPGYRDGSRTVAKFRTPYDLVVGNGVIYVSDSQNNCIRVLTPSGTASTLAGACGSSSAVVDGMGPNARFGSPRGIAYHKSSENIYVVDFQHHAIREVTPAGVVTTIAGSGVAGFADGSAWQARFYAPHGVAIRGDELLVADRNNNRIRLLDISQRWCGEPYAALDIGCGACAVDCTAAGGTCPAVAEVLVPGATPTAPCAVGTRLDPVYITSTYAGTGTGATVDDPSALDASFSGPVGVGASTDGTVYVAEYGSHVIRKIAPGGGEVTTIGGTANSPGFTITRFNTPYRVLADENGGVLVADRGNKCIRHIASDGTVTSWAGTCTSAGSDDGAVGTGKFQTPSGMAFLPDGSVVIADSISHTIRKATPSGALSTWAGLAGTDGTTDSPPRFHTPIDVAASPTGEAFVSDQDNRCIRSIQPDGTVTTLAGLCGAASSHVDGTGSAARFASIRGIAYHANGDVYVIDYGNHVLRRITPGGVVSTVAGEFGTAGDTDGPGAAARFNAGHGIFILRDTLFVGELTGHHIRRVSLLDGSVCRHPYEPVSISCSA